MGDRPETRDLHVSQHQAEDDWVDRQLAEIEAQTSDPEDTVKALLELASELLPSRSEILQEAFETAQAIEDDPEAKAEALSVIALYLPRSAQKDLLQQALTVAKDHEFKVRLKIARLGEVALRLPQNEQRQLLKQLLYRIKSFSDEQAKSHALEKIAPNVKSIPTDLLQQALEIIDTIENNTYRAMALGAIASHLPKAQQKLVQKRALAIAQRAAHILETKDFSSFTFQPPVTPLDATGIALSNLSSQHLEALCAVLPYLSNTAIRPLEQILKTLRALENSNWKLLALSIIAIYFPELKPEFLKEILTLTSSFDDPKDKVNTLIRLTPFLSRSEQQLVIDEILSTAFSISKPLDKIQILSVITPYLSESQQRDILNHALEANPSIDNSDENANALQIIASQISSSCPELLAKFLVKVHALDDCGNIASVLSMLAPQIPQSSFELMEKTLSLARTIKDNKNRTIALGAIIPYFPISKKKTLLKRTLAIAESARKNIEKGYILSLIGPDICKSESEIILEFLEKINTIKSSGDKSEILQSISQNLPTLDPALLEKILNIALSIHHGVPRVQALISLAPHLPQSQRHKAYQDAINQINNIEDERDKATNLKNITKNLFNTDKKLIRQVIKIAKKISKLEENAEARTIALEAIIPFLPESEQRSTIDEIQKTIPKIKYSWTKSSTLKEIADYLPQTKAHEVNSTKTVSDPIEYTELDMERLKKIAPTIKLNTLDRFVTAVFASSEAFSAIASLPPQLLEHVILKWPANEYTLALETIQHFSNDATKAQFLSALAPRLSSGLIPIALRCIEITIKQSRYRTQSLINLIPYLPEDQQPKALDLIKDAIKPPHLKTIALTALIPDLSVSGLTQVLDLLAVKHPDSTSACITLPHLQAQILSSVATALAATQSAFPKLPDISLVDVPSLVTWTIGLTQRLKHFQSEAFSYQQETAHIFSQLAPVFNQAQVSAQQAGIEFFCQFTDPGYQAQVLTALCRADTLTPEMINTCRHSLKQCLDTLRNSDSDYCRLLDIQVRTSGAELLGDLRPILSRLDTIQGIHTQVEALVEIACHPAGQHKQTLALRKIRTLSATDLKAKYLQRLIAHLKPNQRLEAASIIRDMDKTPYFCTQTMVTLACRYPEFRTEAKTMAEALDYPVHRIEQLSLLAVEVPEYLPEIRAFAEETITNPIHRHQVLIALAPHLPLRIDTEVNQSDTVECSDSLWYRALYLLSRTYRDALKGGSLRSESAQTEDLLNLKDEVDALADLLLMRDLEPPMTVGILGGWGGGKSYIMHLMQQSMTSVRSRSVTPEEAWPEADPNHEKLSAYVGHIYQIKFDAWTFAKSNLWASLMQTIFLELNHQISLEQQLAKTLAAEPDDPQSRAEVLRAESRFWSVLYKTNDGDRQWLLENTLNADQLKKYKKIRQQSQIEDILWRQLGETYNEEKGKLEQLQQELINKKNKLKQQQQIVRSKIETDKLNTLITQLTGPISIILSSRISQPVFSKIKAEIKAEVKKQLNGQDSEDILSIADVDYFSQMIQAATIKIFEHRHAEISFHNFLMWLKRNYRLICLLIILLTITILLPIMAEQFLDWLLPEMKTLFQLITFFGPLAPAIANAQVLLKSSQKWISETNLMIKEYQEKIKEIPRQIEEEQHHVIEQGFRQNQEILNLEDEIKALELKIDAQQKRIPQNIYASLEDFVSDRTQNANYEQHLGLMHQVKDDLANLSQRLLPPPTNSQEFKHKIKQLQDIFPRGPARVVVYIDDLDRCPPKRVVEVLEAVQLLVKTPLFIAVLAIDERYITRALEKHYDGILSRYGSPSGTDYLEKIIQLPYRVRPIMPNAIETYLKAQVVIQDSATLGAKFSEFSRQEFAMLLECCKQTDLSPRTLKRLTNVYKLFKIVCRTRGTHLDQTQQQAILALLALSGRYPNLMRHIFDSIEACYEEQREAEQGQRPYPSLHLESRLREFFEHYKLEKSDRHLKLEYDKLNHDALQTSILPNDLTLKTMTHEIFNLIRSFSFVGEVSTTSTDFEKY
ncbi:MAG: P-loop NTPase fold protein [Cyanobacteria bacterium P01_F01_bin.150]